MKSSPVEASQWLTVSLGATTVTTNPDPVVIPLARCLRWRLAPGTDVSNLTFRIMLSAAHREEREE